MKLKTLLLTLCMISTSQSAPDTGRYLGMNLGLSPSKTFLGGYYSWGHNQVNLGTDVIVFTFEEGIFVAQPTLTYNRYLTNNGLYASVGIQTTYAPESNEVYTPPVAPDTMGTYHKVNEPDWETSLFILGIGKSFQFRKWGLHCDANLMTPINSEFGRVLGVWIGGAASYRFKLGE